MSIWEFCEDVVPVDPAHRVSLGEGGTPLIRSRRIGPAAGLPNLWFKLESISPTGSFKDRFAAAAVSHMLQTGCSECIATSSGNTGAALAAYSAAAGIRCRIAIVEPAPVQKLTQMMASGADIFRIRGFGLDPEIDRRTFRALRRLAAAPGRMLQVSGYVFSPEGMSGVETVSPELFAQCPQADHVFCPAGGGGLCTAVARGFLRRRDRTGGDGLPAVHCVQPEGNDTIATPLKEGRDRARRVACTSAISGLQVSGVVDGHLAIESCRETGGTGWTVSDQSVWEMQKRLAREEGIFTEPAGAVALTGALRALQNGSLSPDSCVICLVTGTGFKDSTAMERMAADVDCPILSVEQLEQES